MGRRNRSESDGNDDDEDSEAAENLHVMYAFEQPDEKLLGLLSACMRTPRSLRKDAGPIQQAGSKRCRWMIWAIGCRVGVTECLVVHSRHHVACGVYRIGPFLSA